MKDLITAIGLLFFIEGLAIALFPSKIKNMLKLIEGTPESKLRILGVFFFNIRFYNCLVYKKLNENFKQNIYLPILFNF